MLAFIVIIMLALWGLKRFLFLLKTSPATENTLSDGTDVAGTIKNFMAVEYSVGKLAWP